MSRHERNILLCMTVAIVLTLLVMYLLTTDLLVNF